MALQQLVVVEMFVGGMEKVRCSVVGGDGVAAKLCWSQGRDHGVDPDWIHG